MELLQDGLRHSAVKVSVIIPTFNRAEMVCRCVKSVLDSDCPDIEVIVVDDCSPDDTGIKIKAQFGDAVKYIDAHAKKAE